VIERSFVTCSESVIRAPRIVLGSDEKWVDADAIRAEETAAHTLFEQIEQMDAARLEELLLVGLSFPHSPAGPHPQSG